MTRWARIGLGVAMVAIGGVLAFGSGGTARAATHPDPVITITPASQTAPVGGSVTLQVNVQGTFNMSSYGIELIYNPLVVQFDGAQNGTFVTAAQVPTLQCRPPVDREADQPGNVHPGMHRALFSCASVGDPSPTVEGAGLLATFTFKPVGGGTSPLISTKPWLLRPNGEGICESEAKGDLSNPFAPTPTPLPAICTIVPPQASITVTGPALPTPTVDPAATPTVPAATQTAIAALPAPTQTAIAVANAASTTGGSTQTGAGQTGVTGADAASGVAGASQSGVTQGGGTQQGSTSGAAIGAGGAGSGPGGQTQGANGAAVGRFGSGPDSYGHGSDNYRTRAVALAALGFMLIVAGVWRRGLRDGRREVVRRR